MENGTILTRTVTWLPASGVMAAGLTVMVPGHIRKPDPGRVTPRAGGSKTHPAGIQQISGRR